MTVPALQVRRVIMTMKFDLSNKFDFLNNYAEKLFPHKTAVNVEIYINYHVLGKKKKKNVYIIGSLHFKSDQTDVVIGGFYIIISYSSS